MYTHIFHCSKEDFNLAKEEILSIIPYDFFMQYNNFIILGVKKTISALKLSKLVMRLAYTNSVYEILFSSNKTALEEYIRMHNWEKSYEKNYSVRKIALTRDEINDPKYTEKYLGKLVWEQLEKPKVELKDAKTKFTFFFFDRIYATKFLTMTDKTYLERKPHMKKEMHPTSLNPKIARACINLTGLDKGTILDPFCGSGGILVEAGLMGFDCKGYDLDEIMLKRAKINMDQYEIKKYKLYKKDATKIIDAYDTIVTDLPYGKNSKLHDKEIMTLYSHFLESVKTTMAKKTKFVVMLPDFVGSEILNEFKIKSQFEFYLHKSLSKKVYVLTK